MSDDHKAPQSYLLHAVLIAVLIVIALVAFLIHQWPSAHRFG